MQERVKAIVSGRVQLVMYRDFATRKARNLGLVGEVQNCKDGTVRVIAEGPREKLEIFLVKLKKGSLLSRVDDVVSATWGTPTGEYCLVRYQLWKLTDPTQSG